MVFLHKAMYSFEIDTLPITEVYRNYGIIDPKIMDTIIGKEFMDDKDTKRGHLMSDYIYINHSSSELIKFIKDVASNFLDMNNYKHNKDIWYMDIIRYKLNNDTYPITSGLAWHCENDNYSNLITVLIYLRLDEGIRNGNLGYIDKYGVKKTIQIETNTIIVMDGTVQHRPENPTGSGLRDLIAISFKKY